MKGPEFYEKQLICKYLDEGKPLVWYFRPYMAGFGKSGVSDIVGCYRRLGFFAIEVKRPSKVLTPIQARRLAEISEAGGKTFWGTAEQVIRQFEAWIA